MGTVAPGVPVIGIEVVMPLHEPTMSVEVSSPLKVIGPEVAVVPFGEKPNVAAV